MSAAFQLPVLNFQAPEICAACGGACCRRAPGIAHPEDFGAPDRADLRRRVEAALASGRWAVDWWEGDPRPAPHRRRLPRACRGHGLDKRALAEAWIPYLREIRSAARAAARTCRA